MSKLSLDHTNKDREYFDVNETAELLALSTPQIRTLIKKGELVAIKVGTMLWVRKSSIELYIEGAGY